MPATPADLPAESAGETAGMAGLATCSTSETIETCEGSMLLYYPPYCDSGPK
jgi:hypothetical protein